MLTPRWTQFRKHATQQAYLRSPHRFNVVRAGRRSGKTETAKRKVVIRALEAAFPWTPRFFAGAPTREQAKRIYWQDLKDLTPREFRQTEDSETDLRIKLINGAEIWVVGMDKPQRIEGQPWDGGILDEYADQKEEAWPMHVRPALSDRKGWCDLIGVPDSASRHFTNLFNRAKDSMRELGPDSEWGAFHWRSEEILDPSEIESAKRDLDPLTYEQEYGAETVSFEGRAYYTYHPDAHVAVDLHKRYDPRAPLIFCFDFNVEPGVAAVIQEYCLNEKSSITTSCVIGEVHIPRNSNTVAVCRKLIQDWGDHSGFVRCYGDATGGNRGTAKLDGSDWDLVEKVLRTKFQQRLSLRVPDSNGPERSRVNAFNSRLRTVSNEVRFLVDPKKAPHVVEDLEGVVLLKGGSGEIDKAATPKLTHISDAVGYYLVYEFPVVSGRAVKTSLGGF